MLLWLTQEGPCHISLRNVSLLYRKDLHNELYITYTIYAKSYLGYKYLLGILRMRFKVQKHIIFYILYIIVASLCLSETRRFLQSSSFWEARRALIGQLSSALWLAEYLKRETEMLHPSLYWDAVSRHNDTKTIKHVIKRGICCINLGHNYWLSRPNPTKNKYCPVPIPQKKISSRPTPTK